MTIATQPLLLTPLCVPHADSHSEPTATSVQAVSIPPLVAPCWDRKATNLKSDLLCLQLQPQTSISALPASAPCWAKPAGICLLRSPETTPPGSLLPPSFPVLCSIPLILGSEVLWPLSGCKIIAQIYLLLHTPHPHPQLLDSWKQGNN